MPNTANSSSLLAPERAGRLQTIALTALRAHPRNANVMSEVFRAKLAANIERQGGDYPPLVVRPHPTEPDAYEVLDGHQRLEALCGLGHTTAVCYLWPCDDATALRLLATLNRLEGTDVPYQRAALLRELTALLPPDDLAALLPEDAALIAQTVALLDIDADALAADLAAAEAAARSAEITLHFVIPVEDEEIVDAALERAGRGDRGLNRRGRALVALCHAALAEAAGDA